MVLVRSHGFQLKGSAQGGAKETWLGGWGELKKLDEGVGGNKDITQPYGGIREISSQHKQNLPTSPLAGNKMGHR